MQGLKTYRRGKGQGKKFFESEKGVGIALDNYRWGRVKHQLSENLMKAVYVSLRLAMCTITRSRLGQQQQQRLRLGHRRS